METRKPYKDKKKSTYLAEILKFQEQLMILISKLKSGKRSKKHSQFTLNIQKNL